MTTEKIRVADYIASRLAELGCKEVFSVTGGGAMHLNDAFGRCKGLNVTYTHHEQAAAMAAESYARLADLPAIVCVTTGPGGINALNGVFGAFTDSVPMIVVSGQVRIDTTVASTSMPLRQLGDQEFASVVECAKTLTKYATSIQRIEDVEYAISKGWAVAISGRPGPVWIDVPMNIQGAMVDRQLLGNSYRKLQELEVYDAPATEWQIEALIKQLNNSKRPLVYTGSGIRAAGAHQIFMDLIAQLDVPVVTGWNAHDVIANDHPLFAGRPGILGDRPGNFAVQAADFILVLGSRLSIRQVGYNWKTFAPNAFVAMVDIDPYELHKPTLRIDLPIHANLYRVIQQLSGVSDRGLAGDRLAWKSWLHSNKKEFPVVLDKYSAVDSPVNPYVFVEKLFSALPDDQVVVAGDGTACVVGFQAAVIKDRTRFFHNSGSASMGYDLPAAIGASVARKGKKIICLTGDGSIQMNLQELQTIVGYDYSVSIFMINNGGYHSIRQTQTNYFGAPLNGVGPESGVTFPDMRKIADAYGYEYRSIRNHREASQIIEECLGGRRIICEVFVDRQQAFEPKASSKRMEDGTITSAPLEDMAPFLPEKQIQEIMSIVKGQK